MASQESRDGTNSVTKNVSRNSTASNGIAAFRDAQTIVSAYDRDGNHELDAKELAKALRDYEQGRDTAATRALKRYDRDGDGDIEGQELQALYTDIDTSETVLKYFAFSGSLSTMGKVLRAIHSADDPSKSLADNGATKLVSNSSSIRRFWNHLRGPLVQLSWRVTYAYAVADTLWEGYTHSLDGDYNQGVLHMASRACFDGAMIATSMYTVRYTIQFTYHALPLHRISFMPVWLIPCGVSTLAVLQIPSIFANPIKLGLIELFGTKSKND